MFVAPAEALNNDNEHHREVAHKIGSLVVAGPPGSHTHHNHHMTPAEWADAQVSPAERRAWQKVCECEEGGDWHYSDEDFSGGLGIRRENWRRFGGKRFAPTGAQATPDEQIIVAEHIQPDPPDQHGCDPGGW